MNGAQMRVESVRVGLGKGASRARSCSVLALLALALAGCSEQLYGKASFYVWNGGDVTARVDLDGRLPLSVELRAGAGQLLEDAIAGAYDVTITSEGAAPKKLSAELRKGGLTIVNLDKRGCFVRADVSGLYGGQTKRVSVADLFADNEIFIIDVAIDVPPGRQLPSSRSRGSGGFQRVAVVPCELIADRVQLEEYVRKLR